MRRLFLNFLFRLAGYHHTIVIGINLDNQVVQTPEELENLKNDTEETALSVSLEFYNLPEKLGMDMLKEMVKNMQ